MTVIGCPATRRLTKMPALGLSDVGQSPVTSSNRLTIAGVELRNRDHRSGTSLHASVPHHLSSSGQCILALARIRARLHRGRPARRARP